MTQDHPELTNRRAKALIAAMLSLMLFVGCETNLAYVSGVPGKIQEDSEEEDGKEFKKTQQEENEKLLSLPKDELPENFGLNFKVPAGLPKLDKKMSELISNEKVKLGRKLFFDGGLSKDGSLSCATCHRPENGFASSQAIAIGIEGKKGTRNSPSLFNRAFGKHFFWDGRAGSLEEQALQPIISENEFGNDIESVLKYLRSEKDYVQMFESAFGGSGGEAITRKRLAAAMAAFQLVLFKGDSPVDRFQAGGGGFELNKLEKQGLWVYESRGMCWKCHSGPNYSDEQFHNTGVSFGKDDRDQGRFDSTGKDEDRFKFKTPTLRGVADTAPYMHDGSIKSLEEVVEFYDRGGSQKDKTLSDKLQPLKLTKQEKEALVAFLKALSR